jgi:hypothetical protein
MLCKSYNGAKEARRSSTTICKLQTTDNGGDYLPMKLFGLNTLGLLPRKTNMDFCGFVC